MKYKSILDDLDGEMKLATIAAFKPIQIIGPDGVLITVWVKND